MELPAFPDTSAALTLLGPCGALEAAVDLPEPSVERQPIVAIVCHPLSTEGGSMHKKVVTMAARGLRELGIATVRFNFRGVGASHGAFAKGPGEVDDLRAVADWVRTQLPGRSLWLAGFSFGAAVTITASATLRPEVLISIAPPVGRWTLRETDTPDMPWLVVQGEADEIVEPDAVYRWLEQRTPPQLQVIKVPEASHFFHGKLMQLREAIKQGAAPHLPARA